MLVEMNKCMLSSLIKGCDPAYEIMDHPMIKSKGQYYGGHNDKWQWNSSFGECTEEHLWETYQLLIKPLPKKETWYEKQVREIREILLDGQKRGNDKQVEACLLEIDRLEKLM
jgi:hypothetical protein